ncbi:MAG: cytochrome c oxidase subunit 3 [Gemmatimonadaceae bacterium]|jgi:cytochrome c oxidase subunit III|uniref:cytochrome c oxidase subunit 3 n=1 Tax=Gemmatimonas sp. UBA7669 TaxID=1946568 RepID=UPI0025C21EC4|nr:cytochrome c oxidase subunit 3 [Gemmatimonas sp. UBA7669]MBA3919043.1 cytochrome oxidase subunit III [Gemmatimonas sp.]MBL0891977.1 cytochrome c oxidase subunit 3 [Gemmatimonadaceae bacterium]MBX9856401.1 cytochrome c oxidase subunit 3 [Gemmatimonadaceae bacterium]
MTANSATAAHGDGHAHGGGHHYTSLGLDNRKIAIWTFIGSECMLFASLISTYLVYKGRSPAGPYPHEAWTNPATGEVFKPILNIPVTSASTFVLLMSSLAMVLALAAVQNKNLPKHTLGERILGSSKLWLWMTALLGITFLGFQAYEFTSFVHEGLSIRTNLFGSSFFTLTGFHGAHVTAGVLWLFTLLAIDYKRGLTPADSLLVDICALYWHFVDVVWIAIFTLLYLIK